MDFPFVYLIPDLTNDKRCWFCRRPATFARNNARLKGSTWPFARERQTVLLAVGAHQPARIKIEVGVPIPVPNVAEIVTGDESKWRQDRETPRRVCLKKQTPKVFQLMIDPRGHGTQVVITQILYNHHRLAES